MFEKMIQKYKDLYENPTNCEPLVQVLYPVSRPYTIKEALASPEKMLANQMAVIEARLKVGDDFLPALRADFGTAQIAHMFGCPIHVFEDSEPCCGAHILDDIADADTISVPAMDSGWNTQVDWFQEYFMEHKPEWLPIQHPDVQGPFNTGHLIRGNDIIFDFYDDPENVEKLLMKVSDFMVDWIKYTTRKTNPKEGWFYDRGGIWRGNARLCNCSLQIVSPGIYREHIMASDASFLKSIGMGRIHYCGSYPEVLDDLFRLSDMTNLEIDAQYYDAIAVCEKAPEKTSVMFCDWSNEPGNRDWYDKILNGEIPKKKNIVFQAKANDLEDAKYVYDRLKNSLCR